MKCSQTYERVEYGDLHMLLHMLHRTPLLNDDLTLVHRCNLRRYLGGILYKEL